nr:hypothetical protein [Tanacetum cinerariifolium]
MMGEMKFFLELQIHQFPRGVFINQSQYPMELLRKHEMEKCDIVMTPMATAKINADLQDLAGCLDDYKSTYEGLQFLGDKLVRWSSKKHDCTAMSTAKAEYYSTWLNKSFQLLNLSLNFKALGDANNYDVLQSIPCSAECKIVGRILLDHPLSYAHTATADVRAGVGYQGVVDKVSAFYTKFLAQPWQTMFKVFNRCLTTRIARCDQTKINILQLFHDVVNRMNVDYVALLWWDFMNCVFQKKDVIQYPRFTKLIIADLMKKHPSIPQILDEDNHSIKDDIPLDYEIDVSSCI